MKNKLIEFKNFSFKYNSQKDYTLKNINLTIYEGEKILILGESGCGKSTLCNTLNGLVPFFYDGKIEGSLKINGKETREMSIFEISKIVGTVLQDPDNQFIGLTAAEDIAFKLENLCIPNEIMKEQVMEISNLVEMENFLSSNPHSLSGGQKQRVTLGGAIIDDINILIFDEPLASLDPRTSENTINLIDSIKRKTNKTIIIIEHRLEEVLKLKLDRIILLNNGEICFDGDPNKLLCSSLLKDCGIREPIYLTALKYSGVKISENLNPQTISLLELNNSAEDFKNFYSNLKFDSKFQNDKKPILKCQNINFSYDGNKKILNNVSFEVYENELLCIAGKNGAGKSTISKIMCGFLKNVEGKIFFGYEDISNYTIFQRSKIIGYVMQNPNQMISHNMVFDEVAFALRNLNIPENKIKEKVNELP